MTSKSKHISNYKASDFPLMSLYSLLEVYKANKDICDAHIRGDDFEGFSGLGEDELDTDATHPYWKKLKEMFPQLIDESSIKQLGWGMVESLLIYVVAKSILYIVAFYLTYKHWDTLPQWAKIVCVLGLVPSPVPFTDVVTIVVAVLASKSTKKSR
jgi:hypothetical protein